VVGGGVRKHGVETGPKIATALTQKGFVKTQQVASLPVAPKAWSTGKSARAKKKREALARKRAAGGV